MTASCFTGVEFSRKADIMVSSWFLGPALRLNSVELSLLLAPPLGMNSLLHSACYLRTTCLLSASFLRHFSLTVAGLRAPLSRFLEGVLYKYPEWMNGQTQYNTEIRLTRCLFGFCRSCGINLWLSRLQYCGHILPQWTFLCEEDHENLPIYYLALHAVMSGLTILFSLESSKSIPIGIRKADSIYIEFRRIVIMRKLIITQTNSNG